MTWWESFDLAGRYIYIFGIYFSLFFTGKATELCMSGDYNLAKQFSLRINMHSLGRSGLESPSWERRRKRELGRVKGKCDGY